MLKTNQQLFINARTDAFLQKLPSPLEITLKRAQLYKDAGADGLFVTAVPDAGAIEEITRATALPVNIVSNPKLTVEMLTNLGVKRISMAVLLYKATYNQLERISREVRAENSFSPLF